MPLTRLLIIDANADCCGLDKMLATFKNDAKIFWFNLESIDNHYAGKYINFSQHQHMALKEDKKHIPNNLENFFNLINLDELIHYTLKLRVTVWN